MSLSAARAQDSELPVTAEGNKIIDAPGFLRGEIGYGPN
jgi:hypothetical protein